MDGRTNGILVVFFFFLIHRTYLFVCMTSMHSRAKSVPLVVVTSRLHLASLFSPFSFWVKGCQPSRPALCLLKDGSRLFSDCFRVPLLGQHRRFLANRRTLNPDPPSAAPPFPHRLFKNVIEATRCVPQDLE